VLTLVGRTERVAEIHSNRMAALDDRAWRERQVSAIAACLMASGNRRRATASRR
jgi:hypothetical protein